MIQGTNLKKTHVILWPGITFMNLNSDIFISWYPTIISIAVDLRYKSKIKHTRLISSCTRVGAANCIFDFGLYLIILKRLEQRP